MFAGRLFSFLGTLIVKPFAAVLSVVSSVFGWNSSEPRNGNEQENGERLVVRDASGTHATRLALEYLHRYGEQIDVGAPSLYQLAGWQRVRTPNRIRRFELGQPIASAEPEQRTMLIVGDPDDCAEWIDGLINHVLGVDWADPFRFQLGDVNRARSSFTLHRASGMRIDYTLTIVNSSVRNFTKTVQALAQVNLVGLLASSASDANHVQELKYLLSSFDESLSSAIKWIVTSHDGWADVGDDLPVEIVKFHDRLVYGDNTLHTYEDHWLNVEYDERLSNWREQSKLFDDLLSSVRRADAKSLAGCHSLIKAKKTLKDNLGAIDRQVELCKMKKAHLAKLDNKTKHMRAEVEAGPACYMRNVIEARVVKQRLPAGKFTYYCCDCGISCEELDSDARRRIESEKNPLFRRSCNSKTCTCAGHRHAFRSAHVRRVSVTNPELMQDKQLKLEYEEKCRRVESLEQLTQTIRAELASSESLLLDAIQDTAHQIDTIRRHSFYIPATDAGKSVPEILDEAFDRCETPLPSPSLSSPIDFNHETYRDELIYRLKEWTIMSRAVDHL